MQSGYRVLGLMFRGVFVGFVVFIMKFSIFLFFLHLLNVYRIGVFELKLCFLWGLSV